MNNYEIGYIIKLNDSWEVVSDIPQFIKDISQEELIVIIKSNKKLLDFIEDITYRTLIKILAGI